MLRDEINNMRVRWNPKERRGSTYDPSAFLETPEQARRLIDNLTQQLDRARVEKNRELIDELEEVLAKVESLSRKFFRWERSQERSLKSQELREIRKLPMRM